MAEFFNTVMAVFFWAFVLFLAVGIPLAMLRVKSAARKVMDFVDRDKAP